MEEGKMNKEAVFLKEIREWSSLTLEESHPAFSNMPVCPYAKAAWEEKKVGIGFKDSPGFQDLTTIISTFDDRFDVVIVVDLMFKEADEFHYYLEGLNGAIAEGIFIEKDIWLMGIHPDDVEYGSAYDVEFTSKTGDPYAMIFVQRLSKLYEASQRLKDTKYYDKQLERFNGEDIYKTREAYYWRLKNGT